MSRDRKLGEERPGDGYATRANVRVHTVSKAGEGVRQGKEKIMCLRKKAKGQEHTRRQPLQLRVGHMVFKRCSARRVEGATEHQARRLVGWGCFRSKQGNGERQILFWGYKRVKRFAHPSWNAPVSSSCLVVGGFDYSTDQNGRGGRCSFGWVVSETVLLIRL